MSGRSNTVVDRQGEPHVLVEANVGEGVVSAPLSKYLRYPHPHLPARRADRSGLRDRLPYASDASVSPTI